jgi:RNA polymerase sigma-70 factor (ECF subfamily)
MGQGRWGPETLGRAALAHVDALYRFARSLAGNDDEAEDLVQETFTRALGAADRFEPGTELRAWLFRILRNVHVGRWRGERRRGPLAAVPVEEVGAGEERALLGDPELERMRGIVARDLERALASLAEESRTLVLLQLEGLSDAELAEVMGCPVGTVKSRLSRARAALREQLRAYAWRAVP